MAYRKDQTSPKDIEHINSITEISGDKSSLCFDRDGDNLIVSTKSGEKLICSGVFKEEVVELNDEYIISQTKMLDIGMGKRMAMVRAHAEGDIVYQQRLILNRSQFTKLVANNASPCGVLLPLMKSEDGRSANSLIGADVGGFFSTNSDTYYAGKGSRYNVCATSISGWSQGFVLAEYDAESACLAVSITTTGDYFCNQNPDASLFDYLKVQILEVVTGKVFTYNIQIVLEGNDNFSIESQDLIDAIPTAGLVFGNFRVHSDSACCSGLLLDAQRV